MKQQKTHFDLLEDLYSYFVDKWGMGEEFLVEDLYSYFVDKWGMSEEFLVKGFKEKCKIYPLKFKNPDHYSSDFLYFNQMRKYCALGLGYRTYVTGFTNPGETRSLYLWTSTPSKSLSSWKNKDPILISSSLDNSSCSLQIKWPKFSSYLPDQTTSQIIEILAKVREMVKSGEYADSSPCEEAVPA